MTKFFYMFTIFFRNKAAEIFNVYELKVKVIPVSF